MELLTVKDLSVSYGDKRIVDHVSFNLPDSQILGIVGESGCGKTTLLRAVMAAGGKSASLQGSVLFQGSELVGISEKQMRSLRGKEIAMIPQNAFLAMDPTRKVLSLFQETIRVHNHNAKKAEVKEQAAELLSRLHLEEPDRILTSYPFELSGGMCQRVMIAVAMINRPKLLLADEPTSALDVTSQKQVLQELHSLNRNLGVAILLVSHDLGVIANMADRVAVMKNGIFVEQGTREEVLRSPKDPFTQRLIAAVPKLPEKEA